MALSKQIDMKTLRETFISVPVKVENEWSGSPFLNNWPEVVFEAEIKERSQAYHLELIIPGVQQEDLHVHASESFITVSAEKEEELRRSANSEFHETAYQSFNRRFSLPQAIDPLQVNATYKAGVLKIHIPKSFADSSEQPIADTYFPLSS